MTTTVRVDVDGPVTTVTLDRPERLNAATGTMFEELRDALRTAGEDTGCRAVVLTGAGRSFCAGLDLEEGLGPDLVEAGRRMRAGVAAIRLLREIPQPVVAAVDGHAVGAGFSLAAASDLRIAGPGAVFSAPFVRLGMSAGDLGLTWLLPRQIGSSHAAELFLTGGTLDADRALDDTPQLGFAVTTGLTAVVTVSMAGCYAESCAAGFRIARYVAE